MHKILYGFMGGVVLTVAGLVLGLITGANIGGNYFTEFEFGGVRGYEAVGNIGAIMGGAVGALLGIFLGIKLADKKTPRIFRIILVVVFIIFVLLIAAVFLISYK